jgi:phosphosulfolactate synthase (CoM biosynthesis protein A)
MVIKAATPIMERVAAKLIERLEYQVADQIKETVEAGAMAVVMGALTSIINNAFRESEQRATQGIVDMLKKHGLNIQPY